MKQKRRSHKHYFILMACVFALLFVCTYKFKITHTLSLLEERRVAEEEAVRSIDSAQRLHELKAQLGSVPVSGQQVATQEQLQQILLGELSSLAGQQQASVTGISQPVATTYDNYEVIHFSIQLTGGYHSLLKTLHAFEHSTCGMRLSSVKFQSRMNRQTRKKELNAFLHVQHIQSV